MALSNLSRVDLFVFFILSTQKLAETATNDLADNSISTKEVPLYSGISQVYFIPYQKYLSSSSQNYISQSENQIPTVVTSTEKSHSSPTYKVTLGTSKYATSQAIKPLQNEYRTEVNYPYVYTLAKVTPPLTTAAHPAVSGTESDFYEEVPKKYHYGYRVSNPHTGTEFGHSEVNDGHSARGYYHVLLPDGRLQNVKYWAGSSGYHATITYESQY